MPIYIYIYIHETVVYFAFLYFAEATAGNALPAKFLFRKYLFGWGTNWKCPARENIIFETLNLAGAGTLAKAAAVLALTLQMISATFSPVPDWEVFRALFFHPMRNYWFRFALTGRGACWSYPAREFAHFEVLYSAEAPPESAKPNLNYRNQKMTV